VIYIDKEALFRFLEILGAILGGVAAIVLAIIGFRKLNPEKKRIEAEAGKLEAEEDKYLAEGAKALSEACSILRQDFEKENRNLARQIADNREYNLLLEGRIAQVEQENIMLRRVNERLIAQMGQMEQKMFQLQKLTERLTGQVRELGGTPVTVGEIEEMPMRRLADELEKGKQSC
jgi:hypothetical protein